VEGLFVEKSRGVWSEISLERAYTVLCAYLDSKSAN